MLLMNVECAQPLREGAPSSGIDVFPHAEHDSIITYTLVSTVDSGIGNDLSPSVYRSTQETGADQGPCEFESQTQNILYAISQQVSYRSNRLPREASPGSPTVVDATGARLPRTPPLPHRTRQG